jgi:hypothetical protein
MPTTIECIAREGCPSLYIQTLHSYEIPYSYGEEGFIHFNGYYPVQEKMEPTGTELDSYETNFHLPQIVTLIVTPELGAKEVYLIEIYRRVVKGSDQTVYYRIITVVE